MNEIKGLFFEDPWLQSIIYFEAAIRRHPGFWRRIEVNSNYDGYSPPLEMPCTEKIAWLSYQMDTYPQHLWPTPALLVP